MPTNYITAHEKAGDWNKGNLRKYLQIIVDDEPSSNRYDSTNPNFLKDNLDTLRLMIFPVTFYVFYVYGR